MSDFLRAVVLAVAVPSAVALAAPAPAPAPGTSAAQPKADGLPDGLTIVLHDGSLEARKGKLSVRLVGASSLIEATFDRKTGALVVEYENARIINKTRSWKLARLEAMLEFADAVARKTRHDDKGAAAAFAHAAALDPTWTDPVHGLAAVQLHAGDPGSAVRSLAGLLTTDPVAIYLRVVSDPALSALPARPELQAVRAKRAGTVAITRKGIAGTVAVSPDRKLLAVTLTDSSDVSSSFALDLVVLEVATGRIVSTLPIVAHDETDPDCYDAATCAPAPATVRQAVDRRARAREKSLRELGFVPAKVEVLRDSQDPARPTRSFPRAKLELETQGGSVTIRRLPSSATVATVAVLEHVHDIVYVEESRTVVIWSSEHKSEAGCNEDVRPDVALIGIPPVSPPNP